jgi:hypothetical protein
MLKRVFVAAILSLAAFALADHILAVGSYGRGTAVAADGRVGSFNYSVVKRTSEGHDPAIEGHLVFEQHHNDFGRFVRIEMFTPHIVDVAGNVCEFVGPGTLTRLIKGERFTVHGRVSVRVADRRPEHDVTHDPDTFRINFTDKHETSYSFDGRVHDGDLVVFTRREH